MSTRIPTPTLLVAALALAAAFTLTTVAHAAPPAAPPPAGEGDDDEDTGGGPGAAAPAAGIPGDATEVNLVIGENKTIAAVGVKNYSVGARGVAAIKLTSDGANFVVVGKRAGTTTLLLINKDGSQKSYVINVFNRSPDVVKREVDELVQGMPGVKLRRVGSRFFIEGGVGTEGQQKRIERVAGLYPGQVESLVVVGSAPAMRRINIRIDLFFVQYDKTSGFQVGVDFPGKIGGPAVVQSTLQYDFLAGTTTSATATISNQPLPGLDIAQNQGWARIFKQATLITQNGVEATFESGSEQNFLPTGGGGGVVGNIQIQTLFFGMKMTVTPRFDPDSSEIELSVKADNSDAIPPVGSTAIPGRNVSKLNTLVRMRMGQSLVLSGIRSDNDRRRTQGLPFLSQIPVLGFLFGSTEFQRAEVEGAVFIVPSAIEAPKQPVVNVVQDAVKRFEDFNGGRLDRTNGIYDKRPEGWSKAH